MSTQPAACRGRQLTYTAYQYSIPRLDWHCLSGACICVAGNCTGLCSGGSGVLPDRFVITEPALYGGWCPVATNLTGRTTTPCNNTTPCAPQVGRCICCCNCAPQRLFHQDSHANASPYCAQAAWLAANSFNQAECFPCIRLFKSANLIQCN